MNIRIKYIILSVLILTFAGCGNEPLFTEMSTNRLTIRLKGTFETEGHSNFNLMTGQGINSASFQDDSVDEVPDSGALPGATAEGQDDHPTTLMLDIAEIRLDGKKISNYRQVFEIPLDDTHPFFNGTGIELKTDDPGDGYYDSVQLFIRKMIFDNAKVYRSTGSGFQYEKDLKVIFHEKDRYGFDFNQLMVNSFWDSLRIEQGETIRIFPMQIPIIGGMKYSRENNETVLEVRLVIKNFVKKYEYDYYESGVYKVCHYYGPSDWLRDVRAGETDIGRNLHGVARSYVTGKSGVINVTGLANNIYVIAIPESEQISDYYISNNGVVLRNDVEGDLPMPPSYPGAYIEPVLDYYLKFEKYKNDWNSARGTLDGLTGVPGCSDDDNLCKYEYYWDIYEGNVKGFGFGLRIPPYVAFTGGGTSVTFSKMGPGSYRFYTASRPSYGQLYTAGAFTALNAGAPVTITAGTNPDL